MPSTKAKYQITSKDAKEATWIKMFLTQLNVFQLTTLLYVDNQSCMKIERTQFITFAPNILRHITIMVDNKISQKRLN